MNLSPAFPLDGSLSRGRARRDTADCIRDQVSRGIPEAAGSGVVIVPGRSSLRRNEQHDDAECEYRQSHELKYQRIKHDNSPSKSIDLQASD